MYSEKEEALILARGGSKAVRLKNLQIVGGISLLRRTINTAFNAQFHRITVSTDHPIIALEAIKSGASIFHRSRITAADWAPSVWGAAEFLAAKPHVTVLVLIQATSPFILASQIRRAVNKLNKPVAYDCVFSVTRSFKLRWSSYKNNVTAINFKVDARPRRQDWSGEFVETGAFYITRRSLIEKGSFQNNK
ncbi:CMP-sialic acid synthase [Aphomia sociella]